MIPRVRGFRIADKTLIYRHGSSYLWTRRVRALAWSLSIAVRLVVVVPLIVIAGCAGRAAKPVAAPAPPAADVTPSDEVSRNLALALGQADGKPPAPEASRDKVAPDLVGDEANAAYSGERLTGSVTAPVAPSAPSGANVPPAPTTAPAEAAAPPAVPRVPVQQQPVPPTATPPAPSKAAPPRPPEPPPARPASAKAATPAPTTGGLMAQLGAFSSRENAETGWQRIRDAHPDLLGSRSYDIQAADLGGQGIFYRVRTGPFSDGATAKALCEALRARDQACVLVRQK